MEEKSNQKIQEEIKRYMKRKIPYIAVTKSKADLSKKIDPHTTDYEYINKPLSSSKYLTHDVLKEFFEQKWVKAQPQDERIKEKSEKFFVKGFVGRNENPEDFLNTDEGIQSFLEFIKKEDKGIALLKGKRGSGKTFTMNYILNKYTKDELQKNDIFWVRANLFQIYEKDIDKLKCNIKDYLAVKLLKICLKYSEYEKNICKELREFIESYVNIHKREEKEEYLYEFINKKFENTKIEFNKKFGSGGTKEVLLKIVDIFNNFMRCKYDSSGEKIIWSSLEDKYNHIDKLKEFEFEISIGERRFHILEPLITFITEIKKRKLLLILDSMDNIDYLMKTEAFDDLIRQLEDFIKFCEKLDRVLIVISGRFETFERLEPNGLRGENLKILKNFRIAPINVSEFLEKRVSYVSRIMGKEPSDFEKFVKNYVNLFHSCIRLKLAFDQIDRDKDKFIQEFYENSYRDIYDDLIHNFAFIKHYIRNKSPSDINRSTDILEEGVIETDDIKIGGKSKIYILNQGSYTSGCIYKEKKSCNGSGTQRIDFRSGHEFFNFFEPFELKGAEGEIVIHIPFLYLNIINFIVNRYNENSVFSLNQLYEDFFEGTPSEYIVNKGYLGKVLKKFVEYSILERGIEDNKYGYKKTKRSIYLLKLVKSDPYLIHTLILDTKLPNTIYEKITIHKNNYSDIGNAIFQNVIVAVQTINSISKYLYKQTIFSEEDIERLSGILSRSSIKENSKGNLLKQLSSFERNEDIEHDVYFIFTGDGRKVAKAIVKELLIRNPYMRIFFDELSDDDELKKAKAIVIIHDENLEKKLPSMKMFEIKTLGNSVSLKNELAYAINKHDGHVFILKLGKFNAKFNFEEVNVKNRLTTTDKGNLVNRIVRYLNQKFINSA